MQSVKVKPVRQISWWMVVVTWLGRVLRHLPAPGRSGLVRGRYLHYLHYLHYLRYLVCGAGGAPWGRDQRIPAQQHSSTPHCYMLLLVFTFCFYDRGREFLRDQRFDNSMIRYLLPPALPHHVITSHIYTQTHICVQLFHATVMESCFFCF